MDGQSSSSPTTSAEVQQKFLTPDDAPGTIEPSPSDSEAKQLNQKGPKNMVLNVDADCGGNDDAFEEGPAPVYRDVVDKAIERRSADRQVKMSIGVYDDNDDDVETEEDRRVQFTEGLRRIRQSKQEDFDFEPVENDVIRQFISNEVNNAMLFNQDNHIDFTPLIKRKQPKFLEGYLWGAVIGNGSYGKVKEVIDIATLTRRAVKIMKYDKLRKISGGWDNIRSEMAILRRLNHRNVVRLIEVFNIPVKGKVYMLFEYCIGSVQQLIDLEPARRLTIGESHAIFVELCQGLNYLHSKRISHKDIKPGNLLLSIDLTVKICDFGVAEQISIFQEDGRCTKVNGTPKFQPPECVYGNQVAFDGYKADMWSAGITLYNLVSGKYPFERAVLLKLYECIGTEPLVMPKNVPITAELEDLLIKLLDKDFEQRYSCLDTMSHPWFVATFPEDEGLGRVMERMRTGTRPLTMFPSLIALYEGTTNDFLTDDVGNANLYEQEPLVCGGELDSQTFPNFKYLEQTPQDLADGPLDDGEPVRRPSSRSMPTSAPPGPTTSGTAPAPAIQSEEQEDATDGNGKKKKKKKPDRPKRGIFACLFRSRTESA
uniref:Serine/threonine-protein kinase par-4 n=1 Tax=Caenorhabditis tropicalis TaxID=1561998 RepID=A0A1I7V306_9PELO